jgi:hypothetical protein
MRSQRVVIAVLCAAGAALTACDSESDTAESPQAAVVEEVAGSEQPTITLTEQAADRTGLETAEVSSQSKLAVPYSALLYDPNGDTWVYVSTEPLTYTRYPVTVDDIDGGVVTLTDGPGPGTEVVTVGVAELWGAENGIGQ